MKPRSPRQGWLLAFPPADWLANYRASWLSSDAIAGVTLAAYAIPVSLAYAALAGLPPQIGIYGYLLGGIGYALLGSSRQLAIGPTSAILSLIQGVLWQGRRVLIYPSYGLRWRAHVWLHGTGRTCR